METALSSPPAELSTEPQSPSTEVLGCVIYTAGGTNLIFSDTDDVDEVAAALEILRGIQVDRHRVVVCDATPFGHPVSMAYHELGRQCVQRGNADIVITFGRGRHDVALAARDAGLPLDKVVACCDATTAGDVVVELLSEGDTALLLGFNQQHSEAIQARLADSVPAS